MAPSSSEADKLKSGLSWIQGMLTIRPATQEDWSYSVPHIWGLNTASDTLQSVMANWEKLPNDVLGKVLHLLDIADRFVPEHSTVWCTCWNKIWCASHSAMYSRWHIWVCGGTSLLLIGGTWCTRDSFACTYKCCVSLLDSCATCGPKCFLYSFITDIVLHVAICACVSLMFVDECAESEVHKCHWL